MEEKKKKNDLYFNPFTPKLKTFILPTFLTRNV